MPEKTITMMKFNMIALKDSLLFFSFNIANAEIAGVKITVR
jgi:hypothetical protein